VAEIHAEVVRLFDGRNRLIAFSPISEVYLDPMVNPLGLKLRMRADAIQGGKPPFTLEVGHFRQTSPLKQSVRRGDRVDLTLTLRFDVKEAIGG